MDILEYIKNDLNNHDYDNIIYFLDETEKDKYEKIKELLNNDYGYLDIVLDFNDYNKLKPLFEQVTDKDMESYKIMILSNYINYSILNKAGVENLIDVIVPKVAEDLFSEDLDKYITSGDMLLNYEVFEAIKDKAKEEYKKYARIHYLLDNVDDIMLQKCINDLFVYRSSIAMMGYTTEKLLAYSTSNNHPLERVHDYISIESDVKRKKYINGGIL